jgi:hypothetical protein
MNKQIKTVLIAVVIGFPALFGLRLIYGLLNPGSGQGGLLSIGSSQGEFSFPKRNYASEKFAAPGGKEAGAQSIEQKYEKVASMLSNTSDFDEDENRVRSAIEKYYALIQYEQSSGLRGNRRLELAVGVVPSEFDNIVGEIRRIGTLSSIKIDKVDKTGEYKGLLAKRVSEEKARDSLLGLKGRAGSIGEMINLEDKLLEIESEIQTLGVNLGEYSQENEFCTVKLTLNEWTKNAHISNSHRIAVALIWTGQYYFVFLVLVLVTALLVLGGISLAERLKDAPAASAG